MYPLLNLQQVFKIFKAIEQQLLDFIWTPSQSKCNSFKTHMWYYNNLNLLKTFQELKSEELRMKYIPPF